MLPVPFSWAGLTLSKIAVFPESWLCYITPFAVSTALPRPYTRYRQPVHMDGCLPCLPLWAITCRVIATRARSTAGARRGNLPCSTTRLLRLTEVSLAKTGGRVAACLPLVALTEWQRRHRTEPSQAIGARRAFLGLSDYVAYCMIEQTKLVVAVSRYSIYLQREDNRAEDGDSSSH